MTMRLSIAAMALAIATPVDAAPSTAPATFVYCSAASISPRGRGLIVTAIFRSRTDIEFIKSAFTNYLRTSYAPYGNGWVVPEHGVTCLDFIDQRKAGCGAAWISREFRSRPSRSSTSRFSLADHPDRRACAQASSII